MSLLDLLKVVCHYRKTAIAIVVAVVIVAVGLGTVKSVSEKKEYSAEAVLTVTEPTATIAAGELFPMIDAIASNVVATLDGEMSVSQKSDISKRTITFTALASSEEGCVSDANMAAALVIETAKSRLGELAQIYRDASVYEHNEKAAGNAEMPLAVLSNIDKNRAAAYEAVSFTLNDASQAVESSGTQALLKYGIVGVLGGIFLALCFFAVYVIIKQPIRSSEDLEELLSIPVIAEEGARDPGLQLWGNIQFASEKTPQLICLIPSGAFSVKKLADEIEHAASLSPDLGQEGAEARGSASVSVIICEPLSENFASIFDARRADAVVLCARQWKDSVRQAESSAKELKFARARLVGIALC